MADTFMKPPVSVTIHFPCPVQLHKIVWITRLREHSCSLHEVWANSSPSLLSCERSNTVKHQSCSTYCSLSPFTVSSTSWLRVGRGTAEAGSIKFVNRRLTTSSNSDLRLSSAEDQTLLYHVTALRIVILVTESSSVPCMRGLVIHGASTGLSQWKKIEEELLVKSETKKNFSSGFSFFGSQECDSEDDIKEQTRRDVSDAASLVTDTTNIPCDFLDTITHEVMTLPMTLPSGNCVDRSTLDRCADSLAAWGGHPRDPFTGKLFKEGYKPVFNVNLKSRIDRWLLGEGKNSTQGRTLGSAKIIASFLESKGMKRTFERSEDPSISQENIQTNSSDKDNETRDTNSDLDRSLAETLADFKKRRRDL